MPGLLLAAALCSPPPCAVALGLPLQVSQYAHTAWTARVPEGGFGDFVWSLAEDAAGNLWVGAGNGVWRWRPGASKSYPMPGLRVGDLSMVADGQVLAGVMGGGLLKVEGDALVPYRFRHATEPDAWFADRDIRSNKLLRDRDGGLWIGRQGLGLIHVKDGQADTYTSTEGLSGNIACSLFQDREGNIWYGSEKGLDRFRKLPVATVSRKQGLPDEVTRSMLATRDGSVWVDPTLNQGSLAAGPSRRPPLAV